MSKHQPRQGQPKQGGPQPAQQQGQKRKADAAPQMNQPTQKKEKNGQQQQKQGGGAQQQQKKEKNGQQQPQAAKKEQPKSAAAAAPAAAAAAGPAKAQKKSAAPAAAAAAPKGQKKAKAAAAEPEPESEDDDEEEEVDQAALDAIETIKSDYDGVNNELDSFDTQMNAEIYAVQKKYLLKKKPLLKRRDALFAKTPNLWCTLFTNHSTFLSQMDEIDGEVCEHLAAVDVDEQYSDDRSEKQQIIGVSVAFTFSKGSELVKEGRYTKTFMFDDEKEALMCVPVAAANQPFVGNFAATHPDSFFLSWFESDGADDGIIAAQEAISSELYVDPLQLYEHVAMGGSLDQQDGDDSDDDEQMAFGSDDEGSDEEAPQLA